MVIEIRIICFAECHIILDRLRNEVVTEKIGVSPLTLRRGSVAFVSTCEVIDILDYKKDRGRVKKSR